MTEEARFVTGSKKIRSERRRSKRSRRKVSRSRRQVFSAGHPEVLARDLSRHGLKIALSVALISSLVVAGAVYFAQREIMPSLGTELFGEDVEPIRASNASIEAEAPSSSDPLSPEASDQVSAWQKGEQGAVTTSETADFLTDQGIDYYDSQYNFHLVLPTSWLKYETWRGLQDWGEQGVVPAVHFGFSGQSVFSILVQNSEQWRFWQQKTDNPYVFLGQQEDVVFTYAVAGPFQDAFLRERAEEVSGISQAFSFLSEQVVDAPASQMSVQVSNPQYERYQSAWGDEPGFANLSFEYPGGWFVKELASKGRRTVIVSPYEVIIEPLQIATDIFLEMYAEKSLLPDYGDQVSLEDYVRHWGLEVKTGQIDGRAAFEIQRDEIIPWREIYIDLDPAVAVVRLSAQHPDMNRFDHLLETLRTGE